MSDFKMNDQRSCDAVSRVDAAGQPQPNSPEAIAARNLAAAVQLIAEEQRHLQKKLDGIREAAAGPETSPGA